MFLIYILIAVIIYIGFYFLGTLICKKVKFLKENANNTSVIILSLILIPLVMIKDNEVLAYGIGFSLSPVIATIISHFLFRTFGKKNRKKEPFFNKEYYFGFLGILIFSYFTLLFPAN